MSKFKNTLRKGTAAFLSAAVVMAAISAGVSVSADNLKTTLDISQGPIMISSDSIIGKDSSGTPVTTTNANGYIITGNSNQNTVTVSGGIQNITLENANIDVSGESVKGCAFALTSGANVNLTLSGTNTLKSYDSYAGLQVPKGASLTIDKSGSNDSADSLTATCITVPDEDGSAGIGTFFNEAAGNITINGGTVMAHGGNDCGGIGGSFPNEDVDIVGGNITINGGIVNADSEGTSSLSGGGIGGRCAGITISGGCVTATANDELSFAAAIGGGAHSDNENITITGGTVKAVSKGCGAAIGGGNSLGGGNITIKGGNISATSLYGAGIGAGANCRGNFGTILISAGAVNASSTHGSGIGDANIDSCSGGAVTISGGTVHANGGMNGIGSSTESVKNIISGGSVYSHSALDADYNVYPFPTSDGSTAVLPETITLPTSAQIQSLSIAQGGKAIAYGDTGIKTDDSNKLYLYLPECSNVAPVDTTVTVAAADGQTYSGYHGTVNGKNPALKIDQSPISFPQPNVSCELGKTVVVQAKGGTCTGTVSYSKSSPHDRSFNLKDNGDGTAAVTAVNADDAEITAKLAGNDIYYDATAEITVNCCTKFTVSPIPNQTFTGSKVTPTVIVKDGDTPLVEGTDYSIEYNPNDNYTSGGNHTLTITGEGKYAGDYVKARFMIQSPVTITGISPAHGSEAGGTPVIITGTHFSKATQVVFNGTPAQTFQIINDTTIRATTPAGEGTVAVIVVTPDGINMPIEGTTTNQFIYDELPLQSITLASSLSDSSKLAIGDSEQLTATGHYDGNYTKDISDSVLWSSSDTNVATVDSSGTVTAKGEGTVTITAAQNGISSTMTIAVKKAYTISILAGLSQDGSITATGAYSCTGNGMYTIKVLDGSTVVLTAKPNSGKTFEGWYHCVDGFDTSDPTSKGNSTLVLTPTANDAYLANFTSIPTVSLTTTVSGTGTVSVSVNGGAASASTTQSVSLGASVSLTATPGNGNQFLYWQDVNGNILSQSSSYTLTMDSNTTVTAVFESTAPSAHLVTFVNGITGETIKSATVANSITDISPYKPADPYAFGYTFSGWKETKEENGDIVETAQFTPVKITYSLTVNNGSGTSTKQYAPKSAVTVTADTAPSGKQFSCWQDVNGNVLSYNAAYSFCITGNMALTAVYIDSAQTVAPQASVSLTGESADSNAKTVSFSSQWSVPNGCTVLSHGIIVVKDSNYDSNSFMIGGNHVLKATSKLNTSYGTYVVNIDNVTAGNVWYGRAYLVYQDSSGNIETIYSNILSGRF